MGFIKDICRGIRTVYRWLHIKHIQKKKREGKQFLEDAVKQLNYQYMRMAQRPELFSDESIKPFYFEIVRLVRKYAPYFGYKQEAEKLAVMIEQRRAQGEKQRVGYDYFQILQLASNETSERRIRAAYEDMKERGYQDSRLAWVLDDAYETLSDPQRRATYKLYHTRPYMEQMQQVLEKISPKLAGQLHFETMWKKDKLEQLLCK